jgi:hypothetical protein
LLQSVSLGHRIFGRASHTGGQQAYMTASTTANLYLCTVAAGGTFSGCTDTGINTNYAFTAAVSGGTVYLATDGGPSGLFLCTVNPDGTLSGCTAQTDPAISSPRGMAIH